MTIVTSRAVLQQQDHIEVSPDLFDEYGFFIDPMDWTEEIADRIAIQDGIGLLQDDHWRVIRSLRDGFTHFGAIQPIRSICRNSSVSREKLKKLFGSCHEVLRIAGLPDPGQEVRNYMK